MVSIMYRGILFLSVSIIGTRFGSSVIGAHGVSANEETVEKKANEPENESEDSKVVQVVTDIFSSSTKDIKPHFVMFYAPWCGHCKRLHPTWDSLAEKYNTEDSSVVIAKVDCTTHQAICSSQEVNGYPTLKFLLGSRAGGLKYKGPRDFDNLDQFLLKEIDVTEEDEEYENEPPKPISALVELTSENFKETVSKGSHFIKFYAPWCGHCQRLAPTWNNLAQSFEHQRLVTVSKIDCTKHKEFCTEYEVKGYPTLLWIVDGKKMAKYAGDRSHEDLKRFVNDQLGDSAKGGDDDDEDEDAAGNLVVALTAKNFENAIKQGVTLVKFYAPWCGHCKRMAPTYAELGQKFVAIPQATIAKVDCTQEVNKELCAQQKVTGFPTLLLYRDGKKIDEYSGDRSLDDMLEFVYDKLSDVDASHDEL